jgi:hypothetical protein
MNKKHFEFDLDEHETDILFSCIQKEIVNCSYELCKITSKEPHALYVKNYDAYKIWYENHIEFLKQLKKKIKYTNKV